MFVTGPDVIKDVTGEDVSLDELGGADHQARYGNIHQVVDSREGRVPVRPRFPGLPAVQPLRRCAGGQPGPGSLEITPHDLELDNLVPDADNMAYDMHEILIRIFDDGDFLDVAAQAGQSIITGFARVDGRPIGVIANQPMHMSGAIDNEASDKAARFLRFCDSFNLPLVFVVDTLGFLPGVEQEKNGIIARPLPLRRRRGHEPKVTLTIRKSCMALRTR